MSQSAFPSFRLWFGCGFEQVLQFRHEFLHVFEIEINGGEPHVCHLVVAPKAIHNQLADFTGFTLALGGFDDEGFGFIDDLFELADRYRSLLAGAHQAVEDFLAVKTLAAPVFLDYHIGDFIDALVGGKALLALQAFATATDGIRLFAFARIHDFVIFKPAKGAFHVLVCRSEVPIIVAGIGIGTLGRVQTGNVPRQFVISRLAN